MILVVGATGSLGSKIVHGLLKKGEPVRAFARSSSDYLPLQRAGAEIAVGDLKDPVSLYRACQGAGAVITTASATKRGDDTIENVDLQGNQNLMGAAQEAGVRQVVFISTLASSEQSPVPAFRAKAAAERRLRESGMIYTVLRANGLMDVLFPMLIEGPVLSGQAVTLVGESSRRHSFIAEADLAAFAVAATRNPNAQNATILLGGPEPITLRDAVLAYEEVLGRAISVRSVAPGDPIPGLPAPVWGFVAALETFDSPVPMKDTAARFGVALTSVRAFAESRLESVMQ